MIHIATVHWKTDKWIDIQLKYIKRFINEEYKIYSFLNDIDKDYSDKFFYICSEPISNHAIKLNMLADIIYYSSNNPDDILIFMDGDAFPIGDIIKLIRVKIEKHKLLAIQRLENTGFRQPHPSFCATTIGFWKEIGGDWKSGYKWKNCYGKLITDVGGNLLKVMDEKKINWYPLHRSGQIADHPLWFGIYDNVIYHHGSGFRKGGAGMITGYQDGYIKLERNLFGKLLDRFPDDIVIKIKHRIHPKQRFKRRIFNKYENLSEAVYNKIKEEEPFNFSGILT